MSAASTDNKSAAVIGSGFGGLAAAIRLQSAGIQTVLYEARDKPGGRAYVYHDDGYTFDAGPTVVTAPHTLEELFENEEFDAAVICTPTSTHSELALQLIEKSDSKLK